VDSSWKTNNSVWSWQPQNSGYLIKGFLPRAWISD
jgi:hypothetical protein